MSAPKWLGLLQWSLAHNDGTHPSEANKMSNEDKEWLTKVLTEAVKNDAERMQELYSGFTAVLNGSKSFEESSFLEELEELRDIVEQIDMAQVFTKFGGLMCLLAIIKKPLVSFTVKILAASTIGTIAQNNTTVQMTANEQKIAEQLVCEFCNTVAEEPSSILASKLAYAISCCIRNHPESENMFTVNFSNLFFSHAFTSLKENAAVLNRVMFLANALITSDTCSPEQLDILCGCTIPYCFSYIASTESTIREAATNLCTSLSHSRQGWEIVGKGKSKHAEALEVINRARDDLTSMSSDNELIESTNRSLDELTAALEHFSCRFPSAAAAASSSSLSSAAPLLLTSI